ncbi:MAG: site-specific integrase [Cytophagales bacterium]|nr:site-specific integrase [Cytophagales bacterium]
MKTYAYPTLEDISAKAVDITLIMKVRQPIWHKKTETASRVRQRIEAILDWASARGYREKENPARWRGHLEKLLPKRTKVQKVKHHEALNYQELPTFFQSIRKIDSVTAKALAFTILTATRSGEARNAYWEEINKDLWSIPEERMKAGRLHRVPLSDEALKVLDEMKSYKRKDGLIFPGLQSGRPISEASLMKLVKTKNSKLTIHGMRSSFRDWCAEQTNYPREVAEAALAHSRKDKTEEAYFRSDLFDKRRKLMQMWAVFCLTPSSKAGVIPINKAG